MEQLVFWRGIILSEFKELEHPFHRNFNKNITHLIVNRITTKTREFPMTEKNATTHTHIRNQSEPITSSQGFKSSGSGVQITSAILWEEIYSLNIINFLSFSFSFSLVRFLWRLLRHHCNIFHGRTTCSLLNFSFSSFPVYLSVFFVVSLSLLAPFERKWFDFYMVNSIFIKGHWCCFMEDQGRYFKN